MKAPSLSCGTSPRQAAGEVNAARRHDFEGGIAGLGTPDVDDAQRLGRERVVLGIMQRRGKDGRGAVAGGLQGGGEAGLSDAGSRERT